MNHETDLLDELLSRPGWQHNPAITWMSIARAIQESTRIRPVLGRDAIRSRAIKYASDGSTARMLIDLEGTDEALLGIVPTRLQNYAVVVRSKEAAMSFFGVYLMGEDFEMWGIFKSRQKGLFRKRVEISCINEEGLRKVVTCPTEDIRHFGNLEGLFDAIIQAGMFDHLFPGRPNMVPAYALRHYWLPIRRWMHNWEG
jgi:hypothetical protein